MKHSILNLIVLLLLLCSSTLYAQNRQAATVSDIVKSVTDFTDNRAMEKIYLHTDKPYYTIGDTLWFKAYLFNAAYFTASAKTGIAYIEIANEQNKVVKRWMVSLYVGLGWGEIALNEKDFPQGNYYLRAYTSWMRNFNEHYIFEKQFYISSAGEKDMLINAKMSLSSEAGKQKAHIKLDVNKMDQQPLRLNDFQVKITQDKNVLYKYKANTLLDGIIDFNFGLPEKADVNKLSVTLQNLKKGEENPVYNIPIVINRPENIDLQFMPESGGLVAGLITKVAFKALGEDGNGANVSGSVYNSRQQEVLAFKSTHLGIGSFNLKPQAGETYTAKIRLPDGNYSKAYPLPALKLSGIVLSVINKFGADSLEANIAATADMQSVNTAYYLIGQARGVACYGALIQLGRQVTSIKISKALFPTGVARLTLLNTDRQPLNERIAYIDHDDHLRVNISTDKVFYTKRDSAGINITVSDKAGQPVQGSFSISVTDDSQVKNDSLKSISLKSAMLLTSDLKGNIEGPGYYFPPVLSAEVWQHLDNLLLAQGWVNYDWQTVFKPAMPLPYVAEADFSVKGRVTNIFNKPVVKGGVILLSKKPSFLRDTVSNNDGQFNFTNIYPADTAIYLIQARNKKGKANNIGVEVDEFKPPVFAAPQQRPIPWYVNIDSAAIKTINNYYNYKKEQDKLTGHQLKEVKITGKKIIKDSKNLNGDGGSDFALNQQELEKAGKVTLGDLLAKNFPGFAMRALSKSGSTFYMYKYGTANFFLIIDGISIDFGNPYERYSYDHYQFVKQYLDFYSAEDIKGIEVMKSVKYVINYANEYLGGYNPMADYFFVEATTYSGSGPFLKKTPGVYLYKPLAFVQQKQFYSPKYKTKKDDNFFIDARATIYWSPNTITDKDGKARFSFYTADKPGTYTLLIDGCDMNGNLESRRQKIIVK